MTTRTFHASAAMQLWVPAATVVTAVVNQSATQTQGTSSQRVFNAFSTSAVQSSVAIVVKLKRTMRNDAHRVTFDAL